MSVVNRNVNLAELDIDLKMLRSQKLELVGMTWDVESRKNLTTGQTEAIDGIINLLDAVQDNIEAFNDNITEFDVFGNLELEGIIL